MNREGCSEKKYCCWRWKTGIWTNLGLGKSLHGRSGKIGAWHVCMYALNWAENAGKPRYDHWSWPGGIALPQRLSLIQLLRQVWTSDFPRLLMLYLGSCFGVKSLRAFRTRRGPWNGRSGQSERWCKAEYVHGMWKWSPGSGGLGPELGWVGDTQFKEGWIWESERYSEPRAKPRENGQRGQVWSKAMGNDTMEWVALKGYRPVLIDPYLWILKAHSFRRTEGGVGIRLSLDVPSTSKFSSSVDLGICCCSVTASCPALCDPMDSSPPVSSVHGTFQARTLEWVAVPSVIFPTHGSNKCPRLGRCILCHWATWETQTWDTGILIWRKLTLC